MIMQNLKLSKLVKASAKVRLNYASARSSAWPKSLVWFEQYKLPLRKDWQLSFVEERLFSLFNKASPTFTSRKLLLHTFKFERHPAVKYADY